MHGEDEHQARTGVDEAPAGCGVCPVLRHLGDELLANVEDGVPGMAGNMPRAQ